jgi:signal peptidase I
MAKALKPLWSIVKAMIVIAAAIVLIFNLLLPVYQVQRSTMAPTFRDGDLVDFLTVGAVENGDVIAFYHGAQVMVKRVIGVTGDWIDLSEDGRVIRNGILLDEPYIIDHGMGEVSTEFPLQVAERQYFVLGDQRRAAALDSRNAEIGLINADQIIGKSLLRIWPHDRIGLVW